MTALCDDVHQEGPEVLRARGAIVAERPWLSLEPAGHRPTLRAFTIALLDLAVCARLDRDRHTAHVSAAAGLGAELRATGRPLDELFTELHVLREAVWHWLDHVHHDPAASLSAILRVDVALGVGARAALSGYYRAEHEQAGRWHDTLATLEWESRQLLAATEG